MRTLSKVSEFVRSHKKEIAITAVVGVVCAIGGCAGHKCYVSKNCDKLTEAMLPYKPDKNGVPLDKWIERFLNATSKNVTGMTVKDGANITVGDIFTPFAIQEFATQEANLDSNSIVSGVLVGTMKE